MTSFCARGLARVEVVPAAGGVPVHRRVGGAERVVGAVVEAAQERQLGRDARGAVPVPALAGVVVDDVEVDLDAGRVERRDHLLELARRAARRLVGRVAAVGREVAVGHVAPEVAAGPRGGVASLSVSWIGKSSMASCSRAP